jgi:hypothetical protein
MCFLQMCVCDKVVKVMKNPLDANGWRAKKLAVQKKTGTRGATSRDFTVCKEPPFTVKDFLDAWMYQNRDWHVFGQQRF